MAEGSRKATERNKAQAVAAYYWNRVPTEKYISDGFGFHDTIHLEEANKRAADNLRRQRKIKPLPRIF